MDQSRFEVLSNPERMTAGSAGKHWKYAYSHRSLLKEKKQSNATHSELMHDCPFQFHQVHYHSAHAMGGSCHPGISHLILVHSSQRAPRLLLHLHLDLLDGAAEDVQLGGGVR